MAQKYNKNDFNVLDKLQSSFSYVVTTTSRKIGFNNLGYLPRWAVFCFDVFICLVALTISYLVFDSPAKLFSDPFQGWPKVSTILGVNIIGFVVFRTYSGLIRHSTFIDAIKILLSSALTFVLLLVVNNTCDLIWGYKLFKIERLVIYFSVSFSLLFIYRVMVKQFFEMVLTMTREGNVHKIMVLGSSPNAISIASALKAQNPKNFEILGFIDSHSKNSKKKILDLPIIFLKKKISVLLRKHQADGLLLLDDEVTKEMRVEIVEDCLKNDFKVFRAPLISEMESDVADFSKQIKNIQIEDLLAREPIVLDNVSIVKQIRQKSVLVTGGAGSIGSEIVRQIANYQPKQLVILDKAETPLHQMQLEIQDKFPNLSFEVIIADVRDYNRMDRILREYEPNVVYHAAAYKHVPLMENNPCEAVSTNILGTKNLADLAVKHKVRTFVMVSTDKAVNPSNVMGATKRAAEMYVQSLHYVVKDLELKSTNFITTRFGNVLGSNGSVVPLFREQIQKGGPVTITHPDIIRYFMTIPEACSLVLEAGAMGEGGEIFIFDMGEAVKIIDLAKKMIRLAGFTPDLEIPIEITGLRPGEKLYEELLSDKATTLPTYNEKIMIAKELSKDYGFVNNAVEKIVKLSKDGQKNEMISSMKELIPEFKSMNSSYTKLDQPKKVFPSLDK